MASSTILPIVGLLGAGSGGSDQRASVRHPEDVLGLVFVGVFGIGACVVAFAGDELGAHFLEGVGDVFEEDEAEDDVLVFRRVHVVAQLVGGEPELGLEAEIGRRIRSSGFFRFCFGRHENSRIGVDVYQSGIVSNAARKAR